MIRDSVSVLVVEDEPIVRMLAAETISGLGLIIYEAEDADHALEVIREHPEIKLLFTDIKMPGTMDGLTLAKQVYDEKPGTEIIVTSGMEMDRPPPLPEYGTFIAKPYLPSQLTAIVKAKLIAASF